MVGSSLELEDSPHDGSLGSSASKVLVVLDAVAHAKGKAIGVSELATDLAMPKSTTHRLLKALEEHGFVGRTGHKYCIGTHYAEFSECARDRTATYRADLREAALKPIEWLFERAGATVHLAVLDGTDVYYVEKVSGASGLRIPSRVGGRMPATCTALGKAMLAFSTPTTVGRTLQMPLPRATPRSIRSPRLLLQQLADIRDSGVAEEHEESRLGVSCIAAPILQNGHAVASISLSHVNKFPERTQRFVDMLTAAAGSIAQRMPVSSN